MEYFNGINSDIRGVQYSYSENSGNDNGHTFSIMYDLVEWALASELQVQPANSGD